MPEVCNLVETLADRKYFQAGVMLKKELFRQELKYKNFSLETNVDIDRAFELFERRLVMDKINSPMLQVFLKNRNENGKSTISGGLFLELEKYVQTLSANLEKYKLNLLLSAQTGSFEEKSRVRSMLENDQAVLVRGDDGEYSRILTIEDINKLKDENNFSERFNIYNPFSVTNDTGKQLILNVNEIGNHLKQRTLFNYLDSLEQAGYGVKSAKSDNENNTGFIIEAVNPRGLEIQLRMKLADRPGQPNETQVFTPNQPLNEVKTITSPIQLQAALGADRGPVYIPGLLTTPPEKKLLQPIGGPIANNINSEQQRVFDKTILAKQGAALPGAEEPSTLNDSSEFRFKGSLPNIGVKPEVAGTRAAKTEEELAGQAKSQQEREEMAKKKQTQEYLKNRRERVERDEKQKQELAAKGGQSPIVKAALGRATAGITALFGNGIDPTGFLATINPFNLF